VTAQRRWQARTEIAVSLFTKLIVIHELRICAWGAARLSTQDWEERFREVVEELRKTEKMLDDQGAESSAAWLKEKRAW
jgi:hypothetical protein